MQQRSAVPARLVWIAIGLFALMIAGMSGARSRHDRVVYGAVQAGLALMCLARAAWLYSDHVAKRQEFVWRFRRYTGQQAMGFVYGMRAGAIAFASMGLWTLAIWVMEQWPGYR